MATTEYTIRVQTTGLAEVRQAEAALAKLEHRIERVNAKAIASGVPLSVLIKKLGETDA